MVLWYVLLSLIHNAHTVRGKEILRLKGVVTTADGTLKIM